MTNTLKIIAAAIVLFAAVRSLRAQGASQAVAPGDIAPTSRSAIIANDGAKVRPADNFAAHTGESESTTSNANAPRSSSRYWYMGPLGFYILPVVILTVILSFKHRRVRMMHDTLRAMIEKGMPVTPELVAALKSSNDGRGNLMCFLLPGLICSAIGAGVMINGGRAGLIPLLIGVAFLVAWQVEKRSTKASQLPRQ